MTESGHGSADPLQRDVWLDHAVTLPVLGIPTRFASNARDVLAAVEESFGGWRAVDADAVAPARVRVVVHEGEETHATVRHVCPDAERLLVHTAGSMAVADPARGESVAYVTTALVADRARFRDAVLEAITLALLSHRDRHPLHAAAIARDGHDGQDGHAVLLAGPSGAGKSTLAYVAHRDGLAVLGDDRVWVQQNPRRVWGWPGRVRLLPNDGGREKRVVAIPPTYRAERATVCLLARGTRVALERVPADVIEAALARPDAGFDRFPARHETVVRALAAGGGWRLTTSGDARDALPPLREMLDAG